MFPKKFHTTISWLFAKAANRKTGPTAWSRGKAPIALKSPAKRSSALAIARWSGTQKPPQKSAASCWNICNSPATKHSALFRSDMLNRHRSPCRRLLPERAQLRLSSHASQNATTSSSALPRLDGGRSLPTTATPFDDATTSQQIRATDVNQRDRLKPNSSNQSR